MRLDLVQELFNLGITKKEIADILVVSFPTITKDVSNLGGIDNFPERPTDPKDRYQKCLAKYFALGRKHLIKDEESFEFRLYQALGKFLKLDQAQKSIECVIDYIKRMSSWPIPLADQPYAVLLKDIFEKKGEHIYNYPILGIEWDDQTPVRLVALRQGFTESSQYYWQQFIRKLETQVRQWPGSFAELQQMIIDFIHQQCPDVVFHLIFPWPEGALRDCLEQLLEKLSPRQREVLRHFYGLKALRLSIREIAEKPDALSANRTRQVKDLALERLTEPIHFEALEQLLLTVRQVQQQVAKLNQQQEVQQAVVEQQQASRQALLKHTEIEIVVAGRTKKMSAEELFTRLEATKPLTLRPIDISRLRQAGIVYLGDLIIRDWQRLLHYCEGIGQKTVKSIMTQLKQIGHQLGCQIHNWEFLKQLWEDQAFNAASLLTPIAKLPIKPRAIKAFNEAGFELVGDVVQKTESQLVKTEKLGKTAISELKRVLAEMGLRFDLTIPHWRQIKAQADK
jgi:DNA-directed RNA polymerase alpha subunit